jgi:hypothetical protein
MFLDWYPLLLVEVYSDTLNCDCNRTIVQLECSEDKDSFVAVADHITMLSRDTSSINQTRTQKKYELLTVLIPVECQESSSNAYTHS